MTNFEKWWSEEGSAMLPTRDEDYEEFAKRVAEIAWSKSLYIFGRKMAETLVVIDDDAIN